MSKIEFFLNRFKYLNDTDIKRLMRNLIFTFIIAFFFPFNIIIDLVEKYAIEFLVALMLPMKAAILRYCDTEMVPVTYLKIFHLKKGISDS